MGPCARRGASADPCAADEQLDDELVVFVHTEVFERFEGKGIAGSIVRTSLDAVRAAGERKVMPLCPFYKAWLQRHPDYQDLVHGV